MVARNLTSNDLKSSLSSSDSDLIMGQEVETVSINNEQVDRVVTLIRSCSIPAEEELKTHAFVWPGEKKVLSNCYVAIVAICHQTTPIGERRLEGYIGRTKKIGWDYLKEKFLLRAISEPKWSTPDYWSTLSPIELSGLYEDEVCGKTLNRINERAYLLNDLGKRLLDSGCQFIESAFNTHHRIIGGESGFLNFLGAFEAYKDPVRKKSLSFLSIAANLCDWEIADKENLLSPVDYHEIRGHLRLGTIFVNDEVLRKKIMLELCLLNSEDVEIRSKVQEANQLIARETGLSNSTIHYLMWNVLRNCCPRNPRETHCSSCGKACSLPAHYKSIEAYKGACIYSSLCKSANLDDKIVDPAYIGHFY